MKMKRVWTRQHSDILKVLEKDGRYIVKQEYIEQENEDTAEFFIEAYSWYTRQAGKIVAKPADVQFPVWVTLSEHSKMLPVINTVYLELLLPDGLIIPIDMEKWSRILNYEYIASDGRDQKRHADMLKQYGCSADAAAFMSNRYPAIKEEIQDSWAGVFEPGTTPTTGTIWEIRKEWIIKINM